MHRVFPSYYALSHLHENFNFTEVILETAGKSLLHSTGRNLPDKGSCYLWTIKVMAAVYWCLEQAAVTASFSHYNTGQESDSILCN